MNQPQPRAFTRRSFMSTAAAAAIAISATPKEVLAAANAPRFTLIGFTKPFQKLSFNDTADVVAEIGWDGVECPVRPKGQIEPERAADELPRLVEALKSRGKELTILTTAITSASHPQTEPLLRLASQLGIRRYRLGTWKYDLSKPIAPQLSQIAVQLRDLAALNKELGLKAGFQNHSGRDYVGAPIWDVWSMIKDLDPQHMGLCFDIGHSTIEGGYSWPIESRLAQPFFTAVFVKDFLWKPTDRGWRAEWVMFGEGMVDRAFFNWLKSANYSGPISQHHEYDHGEGKPMILKMQKDLNVLKSWLSV